MKTFSNFILLLFIAVLAVSCEDFGKKSDAFKPIAAENVYQDRSAWQKPEVVIAKMGDIKGKTIADIGAGTGYFTYRFAMRGADCIAVDIDAEMINLIEMFKENLPEETSSRITARLADTDDPKLTDGEADIIFISNTVAYIDGLERYLNQLKSKLRPGGKLFIVDFKDNASGDFVPPLEERMPIDSLKKVLNRCNLDAVDVDLQSLPEQYIVIAEKA